MLTFEKVVACYVKLPLLKKITLPCKVYFAVLFWQNTICPVKLVLDFRTFWVLVCRDFWVHVCGFWVHVSGAVGCVCGVGGCVYVETGNSWVHVRGWWVQFYGAFGCLPDSR